MSTIEQSIDVNVPVHTAYNQWTQFEEFPRFMEGVEEVRQLDERRLHWRATIGSRVEEWDAVITEQHPDGRGQRGGRDIPSARRQQDPHHAPNGV